MYAWPLRDTRASHFMVAGFGEEVPKNKVEAASSQDLQLAQGHFCHLRWTRAGLGRLSGGRTPHSCSGGQWSVAVLADSHRMSLGKGQRNESLFSEISGGWGKQDGKKEEEEK